MSTPPLSTALVNKIKARTQSVRWFAMLKEVRIFSAYCCDINSNGIMGVAKQPVPIVNITPNPVCLGEEIDWDLTDSYAPGSTISAWDIDFGDGNSSTGASIGSAFGSHTYAAIGSYTVTVTVEEGGGRNTEMIREVNVVDCSQPLDKYYYIGTYGQGVWFLNRLGESSTWTARNRGLEGSALFVNSMVMKPGQEHLSDGSHELWIATLDGIYKSENSGKNWAKISLPDPSNAEFEDESVSITNYLKVVFDVNNANEVYALLKGVGETGGGELIGSIVVDTGSANASNVRTGFALTTFFDNYDTIPLPTRIMRSTVSIDGSNLPAVSGRTEIADNGGSPLTFSFYNDALDAFVSQDQGMMNIEPSPSGGINDSLVIGRWPDFLEANGDWLVWNNTNGVTNTAIRWRDISVSPLTIDSVEYDNATLGMCIQRVNSTDALGAYQNNLGNLAVDLVRIDPGTPDIGVIATDTGGVANSTLNEYMVRLAADSYALVYSDGSSYRLVGVTNTTSTVTISTSISLSFTPRGIVKIDDTTIGLISASGSDIVCWTAQVEGAESPPVVVYTYSSTVLTDSFGIGFVGGFLVCSFVDDNDDLRLASVSL